jgi:hypothetical protein
MFIKMLRKGEVNYILRLIQLFKFLRDLQSAAVALVAFQGFMTRSATK